jgi:probable rRNA maturation factor
MFRILIQRATRTAPSPSAKDLRHYALHALKDNIPAAEMTIRIVNETEMKTLNKTYRHKDKPTNVLSFPFDMPADLSPQELDLNAPLLGDLVICASVVNQEAVEQHKTASSHWAHMVVHGTLHLLGFDHENEKDAMRMEAREIAILAALEINDPYQPITKE